MTKAAFPCKMDEMNEKKNVYLRSQVKSARMNENHEP